MAAHEPSLHTVEMVCDRLAELGVAVGPDTARELVRAVLTAEAPRVDARLREALDTALETIRVAAQAAMGVLATTSPTAPRPRPPEARPAAAARSSGQHRERQPQPPAAAPPQPPPPRPEPKRVRDDFGDDEHRPVFRRPRGR
jgi:hypothetical protein